MFLGLIFREFCHLWADTVHTGIHCRNLKFHATLQGTLLCNSVSGFSLFVFRFKDTISNTKSIQEMYSMSLNFWIIIFFLKADLTIPWHTFEDKHLLSVMQSLFTSEDQNLMQVCRIYKNRFILHLPTAVHFIFNFTSEKHFHIMFGSVSFKMMYRFKPFCKITHPWGWFSAMHPRSCSVTLISIFNNW